MDLSIFKTRRFWLILGSLLTGHLLLFSQFRNADMSWLIPAVQTRLGWPDLPAFITETKPDSEGKTETRYTVPTRQFSARERAAWSSNAPPSGGR